MTKKHFKLLAAALARVEHTMPASAFAGLIQEIGNVCASVNPNFDRARFAQACIVQNDALCTLLERNIAKMDRKRPEGTRTGTLGPRRKLLVKNVELHKLGRLSEPEK